MSTTKQTTEIRRGTFADAAMIAQVHVESKRAVYRGLLPESVLAGISVDERTQKWQEVLQDERFEAFLWDENGAIFAVVLLGPTNDEDCDPSTTAEVHALYVTPTHWGQGIGKSLMSHAIGRTRERGLTELRLWTVIPAAGAFYERLGFVRDGAEKVGPLLIPGCDVEVTDIRYRMKVGWALR